MDRARIEVEYARWPYPAPAFTDASALEEVCDAIDAAAVEPAKIEELVVGVDECLEMSGAEFVPGVTLPPEEGGGVDPGTGAVADARSSFTEW